LNLDFTTLTQDILVIIHTCKHTCGLRTHATLHGGAENAGPENARPKMRG